MELAGLAGRKRKIQTKKWRREFAEEEKSRWVKTNLHWEGLQEASG